MATSKHVVECFVKESEESLVEVSPLIKPTNAANDDSDRSLFTEAFRDPHLPEDITPLGSVNEVPVAVAVGEIDAHQPAPNAEATLVESNAITAPTKGIRTARCILLSMLFMGIFFVIQSHVRKNFHHCFIDFLFQAKATRKLKPLRLLVRLAPNKYVSLLLLWLLLFFVVWLARVPIIL